LGDVATKSPERALSVSKVSELTSLDRSPEGKPVFLLHVLKGLKYMKKVVITTDSSSDVPAEMARELGVSILPIPITIGDKSYIDNGIDITPEDIYAANDNDGLAAKTAALSMAEYYDFFKQFTDDGCAVVHLSIGAGYSSTYQNSLTAAGELEDVYSVDTRTLHTGILLQILHACQLRDSGMDAAAIAADLEETSKKVRTSFIISRVDYLARGGRCSSITALGANLLSIRPAVEQVDGKLKVYKKYRGKLTSCCQQYAKEALTSHGELDKRWVTVTHSSIAQETLDAVIETVKQTADFDEMIVLQAGCTISSHCGPDTLSVCFMTRD